MGLDVNGVEETFCTARLRHCLNNHREADVYSSNAGRLNIVNEHKLPILRELGMSVEKEQNTIYVPHWAMNSHSAVYVTRGEGHVQIVGNKGELIRDDKEKARCSSSHNTSPQYAGGSNGFEYVSSKTTSSPMKSPLVGNTSVFRVMPLQVISNSYQISPSEARELKSGRKHQTFFLFPKGQSCRRS